MKICYFDAFSGISGDMTVGALVDAGADATLLVDGLRSFGTGAAFEIEKTRRAGIAATKFRVVGGETGRHRHLPQILKMIDGSALPRRAKENAAAVFRRLGEAEARVHGVPLEKVHFHEVGAVDSISDIAGACFALELLGVEAVFSSALNVGSGTVETEHGTLPVPAPATAALLEGKPVFSKGPAMELTTPTGAALAATLATAFGPMPAATILSAGYGAGDRDFPGQANVLRALIANRTSASETVTVSVIEANIDDSSPEVLGYAMERLLEQGALDVTLTPQMMKKQRLGCLLRVIARPADQEMLASLVMRETTTLGVRVYAAERRVQERESVTVATPFGEVRIKTGESGGFSPEYDDCRRLARECGIPLKQVIAEASYSYLKSTR
ncbi:MAG: nickel pincer cofactor biosynthesis protein LarC [Bryobacterales bacterium]|nr:nickel pincer cofactor biosynthesis protein LarC [Bryobacterales bacterium]